MIRDKKKPIGGWLGKNFKLVLPLIKAGVLLREFKGIKTKSNLLEGLEKENV